MNWNNIKKSKPIAVETGDWDGMRSDEILVRTITGRKYIVHMYIGQIDGGKFINFYESNTGYEVTNVTHWVDIDNP